MLLIRVAGLHARLEEGHGGGPKRRWRAAGEGSAHSAGNGQNELEETQRRGRRRPDQGKLRGGSSHPCPEGRGLPPPVHAAGRGLPPSVLPMQPCAEV